MRRRLFTTTAVAAVLLAPFGARGGAPADAMTCSPNDDPIGYACQATFYVVGSVCRGRLPTNPPPPPIPPVVPAQANARVDLCPPLG